MGYIDLPVVGGGGSGITDLTGDVTAIGPGSAAATVVQVGGETAADVATSVQDTQAATDLSTPSTLVKRDAGGETSLDGLNLDGSVSGAITLKAADTTTNYTVKMPPAQGSASTYLQNDGSGNLAWASVSALPVQTGNADKVLSTNGTSADWYYAGLGSGSFGTNNVILGRSKPTSLTGSETVLAGVSSGNALTSGFANTLIGHAAGNTITDGVGNTIIGYNCQTASASTNNAFILGSGASAGSASIAMGSATVGGASCVTIGQSASSSGSTGSIALGHSSNTNGTSNICSIGSTVQNITTTYLGLGAELIFAAGDFKPIKLMTSRAAFGGGLTNINASAGTLTLAGAQGSGTGVGGSVYLATAPAGPSGNTLNAHKNRLEITTTGETRFLGDTSGYVGVSSPAAPTSYSLVLPSAQGAASTFLQNDGSGNLSWVSGGSLPSQTGNLNKVLATDGTSTSWQYAGLGAGSLGTGNVVLGRDNTITTGTNNTVIGVGAANVTSNSGHVVIGSSSAVTVGAANSVVVGYQASAATGGVAVGQKAITSAASAVAVGQEALAPEGSTAVGHFAQCTGTYSVAVGQGASSLGGTSVSVGYEADASENSVAIGAVSRSGSGQHGVFVGYITGKNTASGANNVGIGSLAGGALSTGANNVFVGKDAGKIVDTGSTNVFIGNTAGDAVTSGSNNVIIGDIAGTSTLADTIVLAAGTTERIRHNSTKCSIQTGDLAVETAGKGLQVKEGTNAKIGVTGAFPGGGTNTYTVTNTSVTANSIIFISAVSGATTIDPKIWVSTINAGADFIISSGDNSFVGTVGWMIVERIP